jgi:hypothetical protein
MKYTSTNPCKSINWCQIILKRKEGKSSNETAYMVFKVSRQNRLQVASLGVWSFVMFLGMKSKQKSMFEGKTPTPFEDAGLECALRLKYPLINGYKRNSFSSTIGRIVEEFCVWNTVDSPPIVKSDIVLHIRN